MPQETIYPMWISDKNLFIHIPKTAGQAYRRTSGREWVKIIGSHGYLSDLPEPEKYEDFNIFAFVRNPYERYASEYRHSYNRLYKYALEKRPLEDLYLEKFHTPSKYINHQIERNRLNIQTRFIEHDFLKVKIYHFEDNPLLKGTNKKEDQHYYGRYDWRQWIDRETVEIINEYCRDDFKLGYEMKTYGQINREVSGKTRR